MVKKRGLFITIIFLIIFSGLNIFLFANKKGLSYASISGMYIKELPNFTAGLSLSTIIFFLQWIIIAVILIFIISNFIKHKKDEHLKLNIHINKKKTRASTDLDIFYDLLKEKKRLNIQSIARAFNIQKEKALEWAKILENYDLVRIEYPAFSAPEVRINEKEKSEKQKEEGKELKEERKPEEKEEGKGKEKELVQKGKEGVEQKGKQAEKIRKKKKQASKQANKNKEFKERK